MLESSKNNESIKFEGMEDVLMRLDKDLMEDKNLFNRLHDIMNIEIQLSVKHFVVACLLLVCFAGIKVEKKVFNNVCYSITVVDERGHYEIY